MCTNGSENKPEDVARSPFVTPRRVIRLDYHLQDWLDWAEPAKAAAVLMIKEDVRIEVSTRREHRGH
jgi:hypothetical protein